MSEQTLPTGTVVISRYCPTCKAQIKIWKFVGRDEHGKPVARCIDCGGGGLTVIRETLGVLHS